MLNFPVAKYCNQMSGSYSKLEVKGRETVPTVWMLIQQTPKQVMPKRTNKPGISTSNRPPRGMRVGRSRGRFYSGYRPTRRPSRCVLSTLPAPVSYVVWPIWWVGKLLSSSLLSFSSPMLETFLMLLILLVLLFSLIIVLYYTVNFTFCNGCIMLFTCIWLAAWKNSTSANLINWCL